MNKIWIKMKLKCSDKLYLILSLALLGDISTQIMALAPHALIVDPQLETLIKAADELTASVDHLKEMAEVAAGLKAGSTNKSVLRLLVAIKDPQKRTLIIQTAQGLKNRTQNIINQFKQLRDDVSKDLNYQTTNDPQVTILSQRLSDLKGIVQELTDIIRTEKQ